jgi:hypothetical protein
MTYHFLKTQFGNRIATNKNLQGWIKPAAKWKNLESIAWGTGKSRHLKAKISSIQKRLSTMSVLLHEQKKQIMWCEPQSNYPKKEQRE